MHYYLCIKYCIVFFIKAMRYIGSLCNTSTKVVILLTAFIFFTHVSSAQNVTLKHKQITLSEAFQEIRKQTNVDFIIKTSQLDKVRPIQNIDIQNKPLKQALEKLLEHQPLVFTIDNGIIVISDREKKTPLAPVVQKNGKVEIVGTVKNDGNNLYGVSVKVKDSPSIGTTTDGNGRYILVVPTNSTLIFSYVGYANQEIAIADKRRIDVQLTPDQSLSEVVVVGYGTQKKTSVVGALESVKPETLRIPTANLSNALGGRLSGVIAVQRSGEPGADGASFFIRGVSTFSGATNPLILLDGVAISKGDLDALAPEVIESFSVLKDATATAVFGTRGANGVLIITTKTGKDLNKPRISARAQSQISRPTSIPKFVDGVSYMEMFNEAVTGRGTGEILYSQDKINGTRLGLDPYVYPNVDWYNEMFKSHTINNELNLNVQGGGSKIGYFLSATGNISNGLLRKFDLNSFDNNVSVKRYSFQNNINVNLTSTTKIALKLNAQLRDYYGAGVDAPSVFGDIMNANPVDFPIMFPFTGIDRRDVQYGGKAGGTVNNGFVNPFARMVNGYQNGFQSTLLTTIDGAQKLDFITKGLEFKALVSFKNWSNTTTKRTSGYNQYMINSYAPDPAGGYTYDLVMVGQPQNLSLGTETGTSGDREIYFQPSIEYNRTFGNHTVSGLFLYNTTDFNVNNPADLISSLPRRRQGITGRATYGFANKYLAEVNFGYNGSENFATGSRFGFFPSVGLGYVLSNEKFFTDLFPAVSNLKIRGSWGKVGNDQIGGGRFPYLSDLKLDGASFTTGIDQNTTYTGPTYLQFANPLISWEVAEKKNIGVDLGILNNKFNIVFDLYQEDRTNIFVDRSATIPNVFGTAGTKVYGNVGEVRNRGFDFSLEWNKSEKDWGISMRGTFTYAHNTVLKNNEPAFTKYRNLSQIGYSIGTNLGYLAERLFIDQAEIDNSPLQQLGGFVAPGDIKYKDLTNDIDGLNLINSDDRVRMGYPTTPEIVYGLSTSINYKKFDFSFLLQGVDRTSFMISGFHPFGNQGVRNVLQFIAEDRWSPENPNIFAAYPRLSKLDNLNNTEASSYWLRNGAFLKLRSAEIGYSHKFARIFLSGYNLLTFSKFKLWDPEQGGGNGLGYPTQQVFNLGVQLRFN